MEADSVGAKLIVAGAAVARSREMGSEGTQSQEWVSATVAAVVEDIVWRGCGGSLVWMGLVEVVMAFIDILDRFKGNVESCILLGSLLLLLRNLLKVARLLQ